MAEDEDPIPGGGVLDSGGWAMPSEVIYGYQNADFILPELRVPRGGVKYPRFRVETMVQPTRKRFLRRRTWQLHVRYWDPAKQENMHHYMVFASEQDAGNAAEIIKFAVQAINKSYDVEREGEKWSQL